MQPRSYCRIIWITVKKMSEAEIEATEKEEVKLEKVVFQAEGEDPVEFYILAQTRLSGTDYLLVTDAEEGDGDALILKDLSADGEEESRYVIVDADDELEAVAGVFEDLLDDIALVSEED